MVQNPRICLDNILIEDKDLRTLRNETLYLPPQQQRMPFVVRRVQPVTLVPFHRFDCSFLIIVFPTARLEEDASARMTNSVQLECVSGFLNGA